MHLEDSFSTAVLACGAICSPPCSSRIVRGLAVPITGVVAIAWFVTVYEVTREVRRLDI